MKTGLAVALTMTASISLAVAFSTLHARAEPVAFPAPMQKHALSDADRAAFLDARIAALHTGLKLSPEQEKLWPAVELALRAADQNASDSQRKFTNGPEAKTLIDRMRRYGEISVARGQNLAAIADAAAPLYAVLSEEQKHRMPMLLHGPWLNFFQTNFAMTGDKRENWRGPLNKKDGIAPEGGNLPGRDNR